MINILLCGGSGSRLWPVSRERYPKQFCNLIGENSLFQETLLRNKDICKKTVVVTNAEQYFLAAAQTEAMGVRNAEFILEPVGRNTAPAITLACFALAEDDIVLVTPSDHYIKNLGSYKNLIERAKVLAEAGYLVTFGIKPAYPETGFGYIEADGETVVSFREKPNEKTAAEYLAAGNYYWNSGMFAFKVKTYLDELKYYSDGIFSASLEAFENRNTDRNVSKIPLEYMEKIPKNSIDYAVMEKSGKIRVLASDMEWSDLGNFEAIYEISDHDADGNVSKQKNILVGSKNNYIVSDDKPIVLIDTEDMVVIDTTDAIMISKKGSSYKIKDAIQGLERICPDITKTHLTSYRPWGSYTILEESARYKIKRILVRPQQRISLQKHYHRSEHWTVVNGTAKITLAGKEIDLRPNESVYIPIGEIHRLENPGKIDLVIIETQVGEYLGEDDIVRLDDTYGRF